MKNTHLNLLWEQYGGSTSFNYQSVADILKANGDRITYKKGTHLIEQGDAPRFVYFIVSGTVVGKKIYKDGNEFSYFEADETDGNIGLLEVLAHQDQYAASVKCLTDVTLIKIPAHIIYREIMNNVELTRQCIYLLANDLYKTASNEGRLYRLKGIDRARLFFSEFYETNQQSKNTVTVDKKQKDIASELGISMRTLDRVIRKLNTGQEILYAKRKIIISNANYQNMVISLSGNEV